MNFKKITVGLFFAIIVLMSIATFLLPKKEKSELENRTLAVAPQPTVDTLLDKTFMNNAEKFMADHMVFRDQFSAMKTKLELGIGKREINSVFVGKEMLLENVQKPDMAVSEGNAKAMNQFAEKYKGKIDTQMMLIPSAVEFYGNQAPTFVETFDQTEYIKEFYSKLTLTGKIDAYAPLSSSTDDYIFYRTDHHWTSLGSYIGYTALAKPLGYKAATVDMFDVEHASHDFLGTLYSKVVYGEKLVDNIDLYRFAKNEVVTDVIKYTEKNTQTYPSIFFKENLEIKDKYTVFLGENEALVKIKTNVGNGKKIIIFKDSYAHSLMQFLPLHYDEILLVDTRYLNHPLSDYVNVSEYQQALFLYSVPGFIKDSTVRKVAEY